ncbi:MAG: type II secretion system F family protein [Actinomycetota bacterium]
MEAVLLAAGLVAGAEPRRLALAAGAVWAPLPAALAVAVAVVVGRRAQQRDSLGSDVRFAEAVVGELRSGASLRSALRTACGGRPGSDRIVRRLEVGEPLPEAASGLAEILPSIGHLVETAVAVGGGGGRMLPIFEELMVHAAAQDAAASELRTALAPVRASMTLLVGAPLIYLGWSVATGRMARLLALPGGMWLAAVGTGLFAAGIGTMLALARAGR